MRPVTLRIVLIAAASAFGLSALAASSSKDRLQDLQIGESGPILRIALVCKEPCDVRPSAEASAFGSFMIAGVREDLDIDLSGRGGLADHLRLQPVDGGSLLTVKSAAGLNAAQVIDCRTESGPARCIEFRFDRLSRSAATTPPAAPKEERLAPAPQRAVSPVPASAERAEPVAPIAAPRLAPKRASAPPPAPETASSGLRGDAGSSTPKEAPFVGALVLDANAAPRESTGRRFAVPEFAPPERLAPPAKTADPTARATTLKERIASPPPRFDFSREMGALLGKRADPAICEGAAARLSADAWALDAMVDLAFCKASKGDLGAADDDFSRLLAYTPDNHEALVGRGLIAIAEGDRTRGLDFLQEALNALPPIEESDRIVEAMARY